ncbi:MAG: RNA methyltransferase [Bacilli bacterium]|nr:RNA methyltransferase [Bacilli bacterium]
MTNTKDRITSRSNPYVKELCALKPSPERFLIEGRHLCDMAYQSGCLDEVLLVEGEGYEGVKATYVSPDVLGKVATSKTPSGIIGVAKAPTLHLPLGKILLLDRVQDPGNVGTLLRTASSFGYTHVYLSKGCASPFGSKAIAGSQGAIFTLNVHVDEDLLALASSYREKGIPVIASALREATPLRELPRPNLPFALVLGNEGQGIREKLLALSSVRVKIEMGTMESLNVGVAGGILMYSL